jgi:hypothetical protein
MPRSLRLKTPRASFLLAAFLAVAASPIQPVPAAAQGELVIIRPLIRKFPEGYCPFPIEMEFTAPASTVTIHAIANTYVFSGATPIYTNQAIDNIFLTTHADYLAHLVPNNDSYQFCYQDVQVPNIFLFDQLPGGTAKVAETFASNASNWDLSQGAYFDATRSADNDPSNPDAAPPPHDNSGGCLGLGVENASPSPADSARTSILVSGLTTGQHYNLTGWWIVGDGIFTDKATLVIEVLGPGATPVTRRTWGRLKSQYR